MPPDTSICDLPPDLGNPPVGWEFKPLAELVDERGISYGIVQPGVHKEDGVPVIRVDNIVDGRVHTDEVLRVSPDIERNYQRTRLRGGEILLTVVGAYFGECAVAPPEVAGWNVARAVAVIPVVGDVDAYWVVLCLRSPLVRRYMQNWATTTAQPTLNLRDVARLPISIPPQGERLAVEQILGALDDKIELNRRMNETLEAMARALFKSWFVDFDPVSTKAEGRDPGLPKAIANLFPDRFEDSELGAIPAGWSIGRLGDVATNPRRGVQPSEIEATTPYIALERMPKRCIALSEWGTADGLESNKFKFKEGEILFGKLRPYFHKVGVAPVDGVCSTDIVVVAPRTHRWFGFVLGHISSAAFVEHTNAGSTGTKMPRTSWGEMARYSVALPPDRVVEAFTEQIRPTVARIVASVHESRALATLRDTLLPRLISGELRVKDAERVVGRCA